MRLPRLPLLALAFGVGAGALGYAGTPGQAALLAGSATLLALTAAGPGPRARLVLVVMLAGAGRMALERLDVEQPPRLPAGVAAGDRALDPLSGAVHGPVEHGPDGCAFRLDLDHSQARVWITARDRPGRGAACAGVLPGDRVRVRGQLRAPRGYRVPGGLDARHLAAVRGVHYSLSARRVDRRGPGWSAWRWPGRAQRWAVAQIAGQGRDARAAAVARAMIAGDRGGLDRELSERFRDAGVAHVLAVSGLHLAVVALLVFAGVRRAWAAVPGLAMRVAPARAAALVAAPAAVAFTLLTGARVSTVRALLVVLLVLAGAATDRRARIIDALGAAALVLLWAQPFSLYDPSFQLSFAATATLALALGGRAPARDPASLAARLLRRGLVAVWGLLRASLWTTLATAPFTALAFGTVATGGLLANLPVVPLTELVIVPVGLMGLAMASVWGAAGALLLDVAVAASGWVDAIAALTAGIAPVPRVPPPTTWELCACAVIWLAAICGVRGWWPRRTALALAGLGALGIAISHAHATWLGPAWRDELRVTFLDVGQGDAAVLELPGGAVWMIDGGGLPFLTSSRALTPAERRRLIEAPGERSVLRFLAARRIDRVDIAVISHPHPDHYEGLRAVARQVDIGAVWVARPPPEARAAPSYRALLAALRARGTRVVHPRLDAPLAHHRGVVMSVLAPRYLDRTAAIDPVMGINDNSLVVRVDFAGRAALFTGDIEREGEELLVARHGRGLGADLVKVPHHGSATSSTPALVRATAPRWAVISCGVANRFGFPAPAVVARWRAAGAAVLRTDRSGAITWTVSPDGAMRLATFDP